MLIPINLNTFKESFLDGDGNFELTTDQDVWTALYENDKPFSEDVDKLAEIKFSAGTSKDFKFGVKDKLALKVGFNSEAAGLVDLIRASDKSDLIKKYQLEPFLTADKLYLALTFNAKADGKVQGKLPVGALSANFGIGAGGYVGYKRLVPFEKIETVKLIIDELFAGTRFPQTVNAMNKIPRAGEVIVLEYGGYLNLSAGLTWGYSLAGTRSFDVKDLELAADYALKLAAGAKIGYKLAGDFSVEVRRGTTENWARFVVRKKRRSEFNFAADFGFEGKFELDGLPASADDFLAAILGTKAKTFLDYFAKAEKYSSLDELEKAVGKFAGSYLQKLSDDVIGKALSNKTLKEFLAAIEKAVAFYDTIEDKIINLYEDFVDKIPQLEKTLDDILKLKKFENLSKVADAQTWEIIKKLAGEKFYEMLLDQTAFGDFLTEVQKAKDFLNDGASAQIRKIVADLKSEFPLDALFAELGKFDTPAKLKALADEKLKGLTEKLLGKAFDELGDFKEASQKINETLKQINGFKNKWYEKITEAAQQSFKFNLHFAYAKATEADALIDVELNLADANGQKLADSAANGDFAEILNNYDPAIVRVNPNSIFTKKLTKSAHLQINVLGWGFEKLTELIQKVEHAIQTEPNGLLHVFTIDTQLKQLAEKKKKDKLLEEVKSNFLLRAVGATFQPSGTSAPVDRKTNEYVIATLNKMAVRYQLAHHDTNTKPVELRLYLDLAEYLGLVPNRDRFISELQSQFPDGFGDVNVEYVVRYDDQTVRNAFTLSGDELKEFARQTVRKLMSAKYTGMREKDWLPRVGFAYLSDRLAQIFYHGGGGQEILQFAKSVTLPAWFTHGVQMPPVALNEDNRRRIVRLFTIEKKYVERLNALDQLIDKSLKDKLPIPVDELAKAARDFVGMADDLDEFGRANSFFLAFDKLTQAGSSDKWRRESAMILTIKTGTGETVTKYLMA